MATKAVWGRAVLLSIAAGLVAQSAGAQSVGVYRGSFGARDASMASADSVLGTTPLTALAWNPAGLVEVDAPQIDVAFAAIGARGKFTNSVDANGFLRDARGVVPDGTVAFPLRQRSIVLAAGVLTDGAVAGSWQYRDAPGAAGATYGLETHRSGVTVVRPTAGIGARLGARLSVGGSVSMVWNRNELKAPYIFQTQAPLVGLKTLLDVNASGTGWGASLGAVVKPHRAITAGVGWRSGTRLTTTGRATGDAWAQFAAVGIAADSTFQYAAAVKNSFPSMLAGGLAWEATPRWRLAGQIERWGWRDAFSELPITLTNGTNAVINGIVGSDTIEEMVPLGWTNQLVRRVGAEFGYSPSITFRGGYAYGPSPVPTHTLTPMTAAIVEHTLGAGVGMSVPRSRMRLDIGFHWSPSSERRVASTSLEGSEYDATSVAVGTQGLVVSVARKF